MRWKAHCPAAILLVIAMFAAGCNTPCGYCGSKSCRTSHMQLRIVDQKVKDDKGYALYSSYHGFRTEAYAMWRGKNASVCCRLLGDGTNGLAIQRKYLIDNKPVRFEGIVVGNPMILILEEYDPRSGEVMPPPESNKMTYKNPQYIHQEEGRAFFESFVKKHGLVQEPKLEGTKTAVDSKGAGDTRAQGTGKLWQGRKKTQFTCPLFFSLFFPYFSALAVGPVSGSIGDWPVIPANAGLCYARQNKCGA